MTSLRLTLTAACFALAACAAPQPDLEAREFFPSDWSGGSWRYTLTTFDGTGRREQELTFDGWHHERRALSQQGSAPFADAYNQYVSDQRNKNIYFERPEGITLELFGVDQHWVHYEPPALLLPTHPRPGDRWTWRGQMTGSSSARSSAFSIEALERRGARSVLHVRERRDDGSSVERWFAPEVGLVALEEHHDGRPLFELRLLEFTPKSRAP